SGAPAVARRVVAEAAPAPTASSRERDAAQAEASFCVLLHKRAAFTLRTPFLTRCKSKPRVKKRRRLEGAELLRSIDRPARAAGRTDRRRRGDPMRRRDSYAQAAHLPSGLSAVGHPRPADNDVRRALPRGGIDRS